MNQESARENVMTLAALLNGDESKAQELLNHSIAVVFEEGNDVQCQFADFLTQLLKRTFATVQSNPGDSLRLDHVISLKTKAQGNESFFATVSNDGLVVGTEPTGDVSTNQVKPIHLLFSASYVAAHISGLVIGEFLPFSIPNRLNVDFDQIFGSDFPFDEVVDIGETYLAGAGAIGNAFALAISLLQLKGKLIIVDPDKVDGGNLNRCILFTDDEIGQYKANVLVSKLKSRSKELELIPRICELEKVPEKAATNWLKRLVVAVDSRRARRRLQNELPGEVFDASTTDIREVVLHFNKQPLEGLACLSCIYFNDEAERSHEHHVAEVLGLNVEEVASNLITPEMARKIRERNPELRIDPTGLACDSLFKQLCGEGKLKTAEDRQVLAPFAFVSVQAGTYLAIEMVKRLTRENSRSAFNYWRISPWNAPVARGQRKKKTNRNCEFCSSLAKGIGSSIWA